MKHPFVFQKNNSRHEELNLNYKFNTALLSDFRKPYFNLKQKTVTLPLFFRNYKKLLKNYKKAILMRQQKDPLGYMWSLSNDYLESK